MWWGGLRGAVGFSLAMVLKEDMWYRCYQFLLLFLSWNLITDIVAQVYHIFLILKVIGIKWTDVVILSCRSSHQSVDQSMSQPSSSRELFLTTALVMVLFTVFLQVGTFSWMRLSQKDVLSDVGQSCVCVWLRIFHPPSLHFYLRLYYVENDAILKVSKLSTWDISCM